ncbi:MULTISPECIES: HlyD family efflux transporter periplasmic adaptor subunit [Xanthomonas]|uniref:HlyD family efflux transporter periplasmic adaptor subunit n=1 Tax=Xanthomonas TaxID=338 RepID=UPI0009DB2221|nr:MULTISPECIES: HlyD family efflux transporter periplasmic adaptor subunit [Xanthomonas]MCW0422515.1 Colicin V secretion protein CvaA [Xanthomonas sacchari]
MQNKIFRQEALASAQSRWLGGFSISQPLALGWLCSVAALAAIAIIVFLIFGEYTHRSRVSGELVPAKGMSIILAPATGVLSRVDVQEGDAVLAGQTIAVVEISSMTVRNGDVEKAINEQLDIRIKSVEHSKLYHRQQLHAQEGGLRQQLEAAIQELSQLDNQILNRRKQIGIAEEILGRMRQLRDGRYISLTQIKQQETELLSLNSEIDELKRSKAVSQRTVAQLRQALDELPEQQKLNSASYDNSMAELTQQAIENSIRGEIAITAPVSGVVANALYKPGQAIQSGKIIANILPEDDHLEAELMVPSRAIGFVKNGDKVNIRYQAFPYQKFGHGVGVVERVSRSAIEKEPKGVSRKDEADSYYRLIASINQQAIKVHGKYEPLLPGMIVEADILGERRSLLQWIFDPFYSMREDLASE